MSIFSEIKKPKFKSSVFNLSEEHLTTMNFGDLVPILCKEVVPSDRFKVSTELLIKLAPLRAPMFHKVTAYVHYFFVPRFQVNAKFQDFINPKVNSDNSIVNAYTDPTILRSFGQINGNTGGLVRSLSDYFGLPIGNSGWLNQTYQNGGFVDLDPFRAYQHIYNCFYRDQNLEVYEGANPTTTSLFLVDRYVNAFGFCSTQSATSIIPVNQFFALFRLRKRAWAKDYFTSALPSPQAGDDVLIPMKGFVSSNGPMKYFHDGAEETELGSQPVLGGFQTPSEIENGISGHEILGNPEFYQSGLIVDNTSASINDLRRAMALQRFKELAERGGTRYSEMVLNFFGALLKDYWVDRPIFLGGQKQIINVSEVFQTSGSRDVTYEGSDAVSFLGERGGIGNSYGRTKTFTLNAPCHGYLFGILSVRPQAVYYQGLERMWTRKSIFDYAFPQFAQIGEQEILNKELYANGDADDDKVFGYTPRYAEYKCGHNHITGDFRNSMNYWHLARTFAPNARPTLSKEFVMMDNPSYSAFNVTSASTAHLFVDLVNKITARRPLPYFGDPRAL